MSTILSDDEFEIVVVEAPKVEFDIPREKLLSFIKLAEELGWEKSKVKRYINTALRLRKLEKEYGKSYAALIRNYQKLSSEEVKLRYAIEQLLEKRKRIEEDLNLYLEQHKLTLELVQKIAKIVDALKERGLDFEDLDKALKAIDSMKKASYNAEEIVEKLRSLGDLEEETRKLEDKAKKIEEEIQELERRKNEVLKEIEEMHGISGGISKLKEAKENLEKEIKLTEEKLNDTRANLEALRSELEQALGLKATIENLQMKIQQLEEENRKLAEEKEALTKEIAELLGVKENIDEIRSKIAEEKRRLEEIEKEVANRETYLEILEGEISAAYTVLKIFTDPQGIDAEDLESLVDHLQKILKIKRGELPALKPLEPHLLNRARENIISLVMPYVRNEFVPKKLFDQLEKEVKKLTEKKEALEEEVASLKRALEAQAKEKAKPTPESLLRAFSPEGEAIALKTLNQGKKVKITCPVCRTSSIISIPTKEELEELRSKNCKLEYVCGECGKSFEVPLEILLKRVEG